MGGWGFLTEAETVAGRPGPKTNQGSNTLIFLVCIFFRKQRSVTAPLLGEILSFEQFAACIVAGADIGKELLTPAGWPSGEKLRLEERSCTACLARGQNAWGSSSIRFYGSI